MKRFHPAFLVVASIVVFGMFAGCTQKKTDESKAPATEMQHEETAPSSTPADTMTTPPDTMSTGEGDMGGAR